VKPPEPIPSECELGFAEDRSAQLDWSCCGRSYQAKIWSAVNTQLTPELCRLFLEGNLNSVCCPICGIPVALRHPVLYTDVERRLMVWVYDSSFSEDPLQGRAAVPSPGFELISAGDFERARFALKQLDDSIVFQQLRAEQPRWSDAKIHATIFQLHFAASER